MRRIISLQYTLCAYYNPRVLNINVINYVIYCDGRLYYNNCAARPTNWSSDFKEIHCL